MNSHNVSMDSFIFGHDMIQVVILIYGEIE